MPAATELEFAEVQVAPALSVQLSVESAPDPASIAPAMHQAFESVMSFVTRHGLALNGQPRTIYTKYGAGTLSFLVALPVAATPSVPDEPPIRVDTLPGARAYRFTHHGPYQNLPLTYRQITAFLMEKGLLKSEADWARYMPMWEEYLNDPEKTPAAELRAFIYLPA